MSMSKEVHADLLEKFEKVRKLIHEDSNSDPCTAPFLSKYAARQHLLSIKKTLTGFIAEATEENLEKYHAMLAIVLLHLGSIAVDTEEFATGETELNELLSLAETKETKFNFIITTVTALNQLGILWSHRHEPTKSKEYLERSESIFNAFKSSKVTPATFDHIFDPTEDIHGDVAMALLEKVHTLTLFYLAQIYNSAGNDYLSAWYCHTTLKRQLEADDFNPLEWAVNAATLSQFFVANAGFKQARLHLAVASYILDQHEKSLMGLNTPIEDHMDAMESLKKHRAIVARNWGKYGIRLLALSKTRLMADDKEEFLSNDLSCLHLDDEDSDTRVKLTDINFVTIPSSAIEKHVPDKFALVFEDARSIFLMTRSWINLSLEYYDLESFATDHIAITQDLSQLYYTLTFFESIPERRCKMHKRRASHLEDVVKQLNLEYYTQECRQIWYELGETYLNLLELKMDIAKDSAIRLTPHALQKINRLVDQSMESFQKFLNTVKETKDDDFPKIPDDLEKPVLKAYVYIALLYGHYVFTDKTELRRNTEMSLSYHKKICLYCEKYEAATEHIRNDISSCKEMVKLLPFRILKLDNDLSGD